MKNASISVDSSKENLLRAIERRLAPKGRAFVLMKDIPDPLQVHLRLESVGTVRGTPLACFTKAQPLP